MSTPTLAFLQDTAARIAHQLGVLDPRAVADGGCFEVDGVTCQFDRLPHRSALLLSCELGDPLPGHELAVYRQWLELQRLFAPDIDAGFMIDPPTGRHLFAVRLPCTPPAHVPALAAAVRACVRQVGHWQDTLLRGLLIDHERELDRMTGGGAVRPAPNSAAA